jgi:VanZ family protein
MKKKFNTIFKYFCLVCYIIAAIVLIAESSYNGDKSASHSNAVGGAIANNLNELKGDTSKVILPEEVIIKNKIDKAYVYDTYKLEIEILPSNSTYQSLSFSSSDSNIINVSRDGVLSFKDIGTATITVKNSECEDIVDSVTIEVCDKELEDIDVSIEHDNQKLEYENNVYKLVLGEEYDINVDFDPHDATNVEVSYEVSENDYISVNDNGLITPLVVTEDPIAIQVTANDINKVINVIVIGKEEVKIEGIKIEFNDKIYVGSIVSLNINFTPEDTTEDEYTINVDDLSIVEVLDGGKLKALKAGKVTVEIVSNANPEISSSCELEIIEKAALEDFDVISDIEIYEGDIKEIVINSYTPSNSIITPLLLCSSDIITIDGNKIYGVKPGEAILEIVCDKIKKEIDITILAKPATNVKDITLNSYNNVLYKNTSYDLLSLIYLDNIVLNDDSISTDDLDISFINPTIGTIENGEYKSDVSGACYIDVVHNKSKIVKTICLNIIEDDEILINDNINFNEINVNVYQKLSLKVDKKKYVVDIIGNSISLSKAKNGYTIDAIDEGTALIILTPIYNNVVMDKFSITLEVNSKHVYTESVRLEISNNEGELIGEDLVVSLNDDIKIDVILSEDTTMSLVEYKTSDRKVLSVDSRGNVKLNNTGKAKITVYEKMTNKKLIINFDVINYYKLTDEKIKISGSNLSYDEDDNCYKLINGSSGKITLDFVSESTYTNVNYSSSDEDVLVVGSDGVIVPKSVGKAEVTLICNDGISGKIEETVTIEIVEKPFITDMSNFFYFIRKSVGHFGAFLVLGILSTFTYMLFIKPRKWWLAVIVNLSQGVGIAFLTEYIQTFVPGRYGALSDVMIDSSGFLSSAITITLIFIIVYLFKKIIRKYHLEK